MAKRTLLLAERKLMAALLAERFPLLATDEEINGADTVDALNQLYADLGDKEQFVSVGNPKKKARVTDNEPLVAPIRPYTTPILLSVETLKASILAVVEYNWNAELADYDVDTNESRDVHIFNHLVALDNWARGTSYTPKSYLEVKANG